MGDAYPVPAPAPLIGRGKREPGEAAEAEAEAAAEEEEEEEEEEFGCVLLSCASGQVCGVEREMDRRATETWEREREKRLRMPLRASGV